MFKKETMTYIYKIFLNNFVKIMLWYASNANYQITDFNRNDQTGRLYENIHNIFSHLFQDLSQNKDENKFIYENWKFKF